MKKTTLFTTSFCILIALIGYTKSSSIINNHNDNNTFDESKATTMVIKDHPDFPSSQCETIIKTIPTGATTDVTFTTKVDKNEESAYIVTLTKDWGITVNGKYAKSSWKYTVTHDSVTPLESEDNDYLIETMK